ncbi:type I secretion target GGXGXDXXX repeat protein domain protein [Nostoc carneum NIES-2107]|nr:type I secretion target GGXGXDXXX repeat protein domain protein [Nostoc carneum NIES-2107]
MPFDNAGNTLNTALGINLNSNTQSFTDWVGVSDTNDYYGLNLSSRSAFNMCLNSLSADANLELLNSSGGLIARSTNPNSISESINSILDAGSYYIRVYQGTSNSETNYNLSVSTQSHKTDLVWRNSATGQNALWYMNNDKLLNGVFFNGVSDSNWKIEGTGDFNNNGDSEIVWRNSASGQNALWYMNGEQLLQSLFFNSVADTNWKIQGTGDFNKDGYSDIVWRNYASGQNALWYMKGDQLLQGLFFNSVSDSNWKIEGTADFNKDGYSDIVWRNYASGQNALWYMKGDQLLQGLFFNGVADSNWKIEGTADFNKDGYSDIVWRNYASGQNALWYMKGDQLLNTVFLDGVSDANWQITSVRTNLSELTTIDVAGNTTANAFKMGTVTGSGNFHDRLSAVDSNDYYEFNLSTYSDFNLLLNELSADANVQLLNSNGVVIQTSTNPGSTAESMSLKLGAGNYYIQVYQSGGIATNYNLTVSATPLTDPGNSLGNAEVENSAVFSRNETVSATDINDFYRFTVNQSGVFSANLTGLTGDADVRLIKDINGNGAIDTAQLYNSTTGALDTGEILAWQWERGTTSESIHRFLDAGNYYLQVMSYNNQTANYNLSTNFTPAASDNLSFSINPSFGSNINATAQATIKKAINFWKNAIAYSSFNSAQTFALTVVEDTSITGSTLAQGDYLTTATDAKGHIIPISGKLALSSSYLNTLNTVSNYTPDIIIHEIGHALGLVSFLNSSSVEKATGTYKANTYAGWAYGELRGTFSQTAIPLTTGIGVGSDYIHWKEEVFGSETMTHITKGATSAFSQLSLAALRDIGWNVNFGAAQPYSLPLGGTQSSLANVVYNYNNGNVVAAGTSFTGGYYSYVVNSEFSDRLHRIQLGGTGTISVTLSNLTANADMRLIYDANNNGLIDTGEVIATAANTGTTSESFNLSNLAAGNYYIDVFATNYLDALGNKLLVDTAYKLNFNKVASA